MEVFECLFEEFGLHALMTTGKKVDDTWRINKVLG